MILILKLLRSVTLAYTTTTAMFKTHRLQFFIVTAFICTLLCIGLLAHQLAEMKIESKGKTEVLQKKIDEYQNEMRINSKANSLQPFSAANSSDNFQEIGEPSSQNAENVFLSKKDWWSYLHNYF